MWRRRQNSADDAVRYEAEQAASRLGCHLRAGGGLAPVPVTGLPLGDGEAAYADVMCSTARFYGTEVVYPRSRAGYFEDHPAFGRRWVPNHRLDARRRQEAETEAEERWRDHTPARVVLTSTGLRVSPVSSPMTWLPFDHALLTGVAAVAGQTDVVLKYRVCAPLLLAGPAAPWLAVAIEHLSHTAMQQALN